jgi:hypothetical protein
MMDLLNTGVSDMANTNTPFGFRQYSGTGSAPTYEQVAVVINYNAAAIYFGDAVIAAADGSVTAAAAASTQVTGAVAGIFVGCKYLSVAQKRTVWSNYWPGSDVASGNSVEGYIVNDPNAKWTVQSDATGLTQAGVNANIGFNTGAGTAANGISGSYLDVSTLNTTATLPFRVVSLLAGPSLNGTEAGAYNIAVVAFNNAASKNLTGI